MEVVVVATAQEAALVAAGFFGRVLGGGGRSVIGVATGRTPLPVYRELVDRCGGGRISFAGAQVFLLDEYVGLGPDDPRSFRGVVRRGLLDRVDAPAGALGAPEAASEDLAAAGEAYERRIADAGGIDLQLLGIGRNGHIGFNEPPSSLASRTRPVTLAATTRADAAADFGGDVSRVPRRGITQGVGTILEARRVVLVATGAAKSEAVAAAVEGPVTAMVPASALQLHPCAVVVVDEAAAGGLGCVDYYRQAYPTPPGGRRGHPDIAPAAAAAPEAGASKGPVR